MKRTLALATIIAAAWAAVAAADGGGPSPGPTFGWAGTENAAGTLRYVALVAGKGTVLEAVRTHDGKVLR